MRGSKSETASGLMMLNKTLQLSTGMVGYFFPGLNKQMWTVSGKSLIASKRLYKPLASILSRFF